MTTQAEKSNKPTHYVRTMTGYGKDKSFETIGAAWIDFDENNIYVKLHGTQVVDRGFYILPNNASVNDEGGR